MATGCEATAQTWIQTSILLTSYLYERLGKCRKSHVSHHNGQKHRSYKKKEISRSGCPVNSICELSVVPPPGNLAHCYVVVVKGTARSCRVRPPDPERAEGSGGRAVGRRRECLEAAPWGALPSSALTSCPLTPFGHEGECSAPSLSLENSGARSRLHLWRQSNTEMHHV